MAAETKTAGAKFETIGSASMKAKFKKHCAKLNVSQSQRLRDLVQKDLKENKVR